MTQFQIDKRDMMFNLKECPGLAPLQESGGFEDCDEDTLEMIFDQSFSFCEKVLAPLLAPGDRQGCRFENGQVLLPEGMAEAWETYKEMGMIGMNCTSEYGGSELPHFFSTPATEMECGSFVSFSMLPMLTRGAARLVSSFGSQDLKDTYLEKMFNGEWSGTMCLTEPSAGSDVGASVTVAVPDGDNYKIKGTKIFISWGQHDLTENIIHLVLARIKGSPRGSKGLSLFVVPRNRLDADGNAGENNDVACGNIEHKMGINACPTCVINFGSDDACTGYLVGEVNLGMRYMFQMMNEARLEVGIQGMAQGSSAYRQALVYASERVQGVTVAESGPRPAQIIEHPDVRRMLVKMRALVQGSRSLIYHTMLYMDLAAHHPTEKEKYQSLVDLMVPLCKSYGSDQGFRVTEMAVQTYGGYGFCQEYPVEQYMRDSKITSIYEGTNGIQAMDLVFRKILMNKGAFLGLWAQEAAALIGACAGTQLVPLTKTLGEAVEAVVATATYFGECAAKGGGELVQFLATDFQEHMGHVVVGYFLLKQSLVASQALDGDSSAEDTHFYEQKIVTTRYFFESFIPAAIAALANMRETNSAGLQAEFA